MAAVTKPKPKPKGKAWNVFSVSIAIREQLAAKGKLSGLVEMAILSYVWEQTWAKARTPGSAAPDEAQISTAQFARAAGCRGKNGADVVQRALARLRGAGILAGRKEGRTQVLFWKLTPDEWAAAPVYVPALRLESIDKELGIDESDDEPLAEDPTENSQGALPGLEHVALATEQAQAIALAAGGKLEVENQLPLNVDVDVQRRKSGTRLILREEASATSDPQVGGHKLSDGAAADELVRYLASPADEAMRVCVTRVEAVGLVKSMGGARNLDAFWQRWRQRARALLSQRKPMTLPIVRGMASDTGQHVIDFARAQRRQGRAS